MDFTKKPDPIEANLNEKNLSEVQRVLFASILGSQYIFYIDDDKTLRVWHQQEEEKKE